ncbi:MAG: hypothetical protein ACO1OB_28245 [Archangium sp.]
MTRRSVRYPAVRGGLSGLLMLLAPFVWVVDVSSCGGNGPVERELTGLALMGKFDLEWTAWVLAAMTVTVVIPFIAVRIQRPGREVGLQLLGLVATVFFAWLGQMTMFFAIFSERVPRIAGVVVMGSFVAMISDAIARLVFSVKQWRASTQLRSK